jgi:uncharacterized membrane protein
MQNYGLQRFAALHLSNELRGPGPTGPELTEFVKTLRAFTGQDGKFDATRYAQFRDSLKIDTSLSEADVARVLADDFRYDRLQKLLAGPGYVMANDVKQQLARAETSWTLAVATADTWATEVGLLSAAPPRLVTSGRIVRPGTSGAVTVLGTVAAVVGAATIGLAAALLYSLRDVVTFGGFGLFDVGGLPLLPIGALAGLVGAAFDSLLGATAQGVYAPGPALGPRGGDETERSTAPDGTPLERVRGWRWMTNDVVNALALTLGGVVAWVLYRGV